MAPNVSVRDERRRACGVSLLSSSQSRTHPSPPPACWRRQNTVDAKLPVVRHGGAGFFEKLPLVVTSNARNFSRKRNGLAQTRQPDRRARQDAASRRWPSTILRRMSSKRRPTPRRSACVAVSTVAARITMGSPSRNPCRRHPSPLGTAVNEPGHECAAARSPLRCHRAVGRAFE